jgi:hypothetical protein
MQRIAHAVNRMKAQHERYAQLKQWKLQETEASIMATHFLTRIHVKRIL